MVARQFRNTTQIGATSMPSLEPERSIPVAFYVRVATFMAFTLLMIASTLFQAFDTEVDSPVSDMIFACVAPLAFVCFATQVRPYHCHCHCHCHCYSTASWSLNAILTL